MDAAVRQRVIEARDRIVRTELQLERMAAEMARLHHRIALLEATNGLSTPRRSDARAQEAARLRREGLSVRAIALEIGANRNSVLRWVADVPAPQVIVGVDGRVRRNGFTPGRRAT